MSRITSYKVPQASIQKVRRYWLTIAFFLGFIVDNITLNRVDQIFDNIVLATYVVLAMVSLLLLYASVADRLPEKISPFFRKYSPLLVQFSFGGLLSGMLIFYSRSGSLFESWPFLVIILGVIIGNETIQDRSGRLIYNIGIFFIALFAYVVLVVPVVTGMMGPWVFVGSGLIALFIIYWFIRALGRIIPRFLKLQIRKIIFTIGLTYFTLNFLYFANIIPPIPLSLKDVGIYYSVVKFDDGRYQLTYEKPAWWQFLRDSDDVFRYTEGDNVFCFASVFAPTRFETDIFHKWERFDEGSEEWVEHSRLSYPISGGRDGGFRGFTLIRNYEDGKWRCTVETERGQVLGREAFTVESGERGELVTRIE